MTGKAAMPMQPGSRAARYFVTGTDTGVGKTLITAALLQAVAARGRRSLGLKPVSAGWTEGRPVNPDVLAIQAAASVSLSAEMINPVSFERPIAPHIAADETGITIDADKLVRHCQQVCASEQPEFVAVEGAGGWQVPLGSESTMVDLCTGLGFPVILVVGLRLGCLNHALLTADAIRAAGLGLAGWVANHVDPEMSAAEENLLTLQARIPAPLIGNVPFFDADPDIAAVAAHLNIETLLS